MTTISQASREAPMSAAMLVPRIAPAHAAPTYAVLGDVLTVKATAADTGGAYSVFEERTLPGQGMPPHLHQYEEETFIVLEGRFRLQIDGRATDLDEDDYAFVPRGTVHSFVNIGPAVGRLLVLVTPGGIIEHFIAEIGTPVAGPDGPHPAAGTIEPHHLAAVAAKYGMEFFPTEA
jgi:quercetin dioxygenase-like cupin family protein